MESKRGPEKPDLYVVARFVETLHQNGSMKKTNLQMSTRLNYGAFQGYLSWFIEHGLVELSHSGNDEAERVSLTPKGLECYERLVAWIRETMEDLKL